MRGLRKSGNSAYHDVGGIYNHIRDPNDRRRMALAEIDKSPLGWHHLRLVIVTGVGFFTDAYSLFAVSLASTMIGIVYFQDHNGKLPKSSDTAIKVASSAGTVFGQLVFGYLADVLGRKKMYGVELLIIIIGTLAQSLASASPAVSIVGLLVFWRFVVGVGVGGDYPLSAVITAELADTKWRGMMTAAVFAMQGLGQCVAALLALIVTVANKKTLERASSLSDCDADCRYSVDIMWRVVVGFAGIPGWFALYYRLTIPETPRYTFDVKQDLEKATADSHKFISGRKGSSGVNDLERAQARLEMAKYHKHPPALLEFLRYFSKRKNFLQLVGTAGSWFFLDIAFYGLGLNTPTILSTIGFNPNGTIYDTLFNSAVGQLVLVCAGAIPGYWVTVLTVDFIGRKPIQIGGFAILTLLFAIIGFCLKSLSQKALLALYILAQFFFNFGPNATTFILPAECFPTRLRATAHGFSAAAGKVGAVIAQLVFAPMIARGATPEDPHPWLNHVMQIFALLMLAGLGTSLLVPETKRRSLEEIAGKKGQEEYELRFVSRFFRQESRPERGWLRFSG
ncbi:phosphate permease [Microthyrium microscopicum]|uniref:Phosphate permease n=1 Tax=Microthyrium microscopicum TaxID=703497 RepID=A0A6A6UK82_9PEZI|nr:phosphate permease [Microthyrium microscopicum]